MRRRLIEAFRRIARWLSRSTRKGHVTGLTAIEYEAVTMIAYEGKGAYARAREEAGKCRDRGSRQGFAFWSAVADEIAYRTKGRVPERR